MKFVYHEIDRVFDLDDGTLNTVVIENQGLFCRLLTDIIRQVDGSKGRSVVSHDDDPIDMSKYVEVIDSFIPFDVNRKSLLTKISAALERQAVSPDFYESTMMTLGEVERYLNSLAFDFPCDIVFPKLSIASMIKAAAPELRIDAEGIADELIDYIELVNAFDRNKLFVTVNMRSYVGDDEAELFANTVIPRGYRILMIESSEHPRLSAENRVIIDRDLCEIC